ncbi:MAG: hypothetical protein CMD14_09460 [Flavobacteriales bacterium]|nr:hypothetical protein [Flavobacteriales bacterium]|tara:strand:+ start:8252 stop:8611 length:360 start_codon:yes stop_codon:yes gene_type:complete
MTNHVAIFKRTELIYVYDSDDERIREQRRKKRVKKEKKERKKTVRVKKILCNDCGEYFNSNVKGFIKYEKDIHICPQCVEDAEQVLCAEETETQNFEYQSVLRKSIEILKENNTYVLKN